MNTVFAENDLVGLKSLPVTRKGFSDWRAGLAKAEGAPCEELELLRLLLEDSEVQSLLEDSSVDSLHLRSENSD